MSSRMASLMAMLPAGGDGKLSWGELLEAIAAVAGAIAVVGVLGWLLKRFGIGAHAAPSRLGSAFENLQSLLEPGKRHVIEAKRRERGEQDENGDTSRDSGRNLR